MESWIRESSLYQEWQQEAEQRGRQEGRQEGQLEERRSLAIKMLQENLPLEMIARLTEFSIEQLEQLQTNPPS